MLLDELKSNNKILNVYKISTNLIVLDSISRYNNADFIERTSYYA